MYYFGHSGTCPGNLCFVQVLYPWPREAPLIDPITDPPWARGFKERVQELRDSINNVRLPDVFYGEHLKEFTNHNTGQTEVRPAWEDMPALEDVISSIDEQIKRVVPNDLEGTPGYIHCAWKYGMQDAASVLAEWHDRMKEAFKERT